jgi:signal transduction histidine kinase
LQRWKRKDLVKPQKKANEAKSAFLSTVSHELRTPTYFGAWFCKIIKKRLEEKIFPIVDKQDPKTEKNDQPGFRKSSCGKFLKVKDSTH